MQWSSNGIWQQATAVGTVGERGRHRLSSSFFFWIRCLFSHGDKHNFIWIVIRFPCRPQQQRYTVITTGIGGFASQTEKPRIRTIISLPCVSVTHSGRRTSASCTAKCSLPCAFFAHSEVLCRVTKLTHNKYFLKKKVVPRASTARRVWILLSGLNWA